MLKKPHAGPQRLNLTTRLISIATHHKVLINTAATCTVQYENTVFIQTVKGNHMILITPAHATAKKSELFTVHLLLCCFCSFTKMNCWGNLLNFQMKQSAEGVFLHCRLLLPVALKKKGLMQDSDKGNKVF